MRVNQESNVIWANIFKKPKYFKLCLKEILKKYFNEQNKWVWKENVLL